MTFRNFCFTHNNYSDTSLEDEISCKYIVYGREVGESGTPHLQGFLSFSSAKSLSAAIKSLPGYYDPEDIKRYQLHTIVKEK